MSVCDGLRVLDYHVKNKNMRDKVSVPYMLMGILFNVCLITSNLLEIKMVEVMGITVTAGLLVFPISYIINDCLTEVWGFRKARLIIWSGFAMNFFVVGVGYLAAHLPAPDFWQGEEHFRYVFSFAPRIVAASMLAFLSGSFFNAYVMSRMKVLHRGKHFSLRAILSTIVGESVDSLIFFPLAFGGTMPIREMLMLMLVQILLKTLYEVIVLPITIRVVRRVKELDGSDVYDYDISYNILKIKDL